MNDIEKLYENCGIKKQRECECGEHCAYYGVVSCEECDFEDEMVYPPFTAEKQIKLIEFFISSVWWLNLKSLDETLDYSLNFENKLAKLVNRLWQEFTKEQQQQIKEILEWMK